MDKQDLICYEQPLNEHTRICLRVEQLFKQIDHWQQSQAMWDSHACLATLLDILNIIDRPDLKARLAQEFKQYFNQYYRLRDHPNIERQKLTKICDTLGTIIEHLYQHHGKLGQELRDDQFLSNIRQHLLSPGAVCSFDTPSYYHWLQQTAKQRQQDLKSWINKLALLRQAVNTLLHLVRDSHTPTEITAVRGLYQGSIDTQQTIQIIQVLLAKKLALVPEISAGRHRFSIRFFVSSHCERPLPYYHDTPFLLNCC